MRITLLVTVDVEDAASLGEEVGRPLTMENEADVAEVVGQEVLSHFTYLDLACRVDWRCAGYAAGALRAALGRPGPAVGPRHQHSHRG
jgi:hypothetical protein